MIVAGGDGGERAAGDGGLAVAVATPTGQRAVGLDAQAVISAGGDGGERAAGDGGLAIDVVAPGDDFAVGIGQRADRRLCCFNGISRQLRVSPRIPRMTNGSLSIAWVYLSQGIRSQDRRLP